MATNTTTVNDRGANRGFSYHYQGIWWLTLIRGILMLLLGIFVLVWPAATFTAVLWLLGLYSLLAGISDLIMGIVLLARGQSDGWWIIALGMLGLLLGILILRYPGVSAITLVYLLGFWFIVTGFAGLFRSSPSAIMRSLYIIGGILGIILGVLLLFKPVVSGVIFFWVLGVYSLIAGPVYIVLALQEKGATPTRRDKLSYP